MSILDEKIAFLTAPPLTDGEDERYSHFSISQHSATLMEHCRRAIKKGATLGAHGLPLIGTGDWNDGLNLVGEKGRGESIWLAWFLYDVLTRFANLCERCGDNQLAQEYRRQAQSYAAGSGTIWVGWRMVPAGIR